MLVFIIGRLDQVYLNNPTQNTGNTHRLVPTSRKLSPCHENTNFRESHDVNTTNELDIEHTSKSVTSLKVDCVTINPPRC